MTERREGARAPYWLLLGCAIAGCGGGMPLLHPAQTLRLGDVRALAGFSSNIAVGELASATRNAVNEAAGNPNAAGARQRHLRQGRARGGLHRPGLGTNRRRPRRHRRAERGRARLHAGAPSERTFDEPSGSRRRGRSASAWAARRPCTGATSSPRYPTSTWAAFTAGEPTSRCSIGYQSDGDLYMVWLGARGGWEHVDVGDLTSEPGKRPARDRRPSRSRRRGSGAGASSAPPSGFRHVHVAMELDVSYASVTGDYNETHARVEGVTLTPAAALWWLF